MLIKSDCSLSSQPLWCLLGRLRQWVSHNKHSSQCLHSDTCTALRGVNDSAGGLRSTCGWHAPARHVWQSALGPPSTWPSSQHWQIVTAAWGSCSNRKVEQDNKYWPCSSGVLKAKWVFSGHNVYLPHPSPLWWRTAVWAPPVTCISIKQSQVLLPVATLLKRCLGASHHRPHKRKKMLLFFLRITAACFFFPPLFFLLQSPQALFPLFSFPCSMWQGYRKNGGCQGNSSFPGCKPVTCSFPGGDETRKCSTSGRKHGILRADFIYHI